ncbi:hypothetical protein NicSoilB4_11000 [Arthrobacter sp. NicSoilB4]|uniref:winged helix DNA-binding domain-containing protein n=1 Tax=Arthrobacter sp. NicSoilB4 TaxID=2830997 RepID=UPI001CC478F0|nr:winged helix DNA-binding domain-containing protein [Arthrobacter sp. NicSoilB4]BCW66337.1 hypothetical protein NicSoilB4_11000 [Arthrobacter sp. NicSoilB4]
MDPDDVVRLRLRHQRLREPYASTTEDALKHLLAVQSQEFAYARWTLAQRSPGGTAAAVERAVSDGTILRTHILRPTWHFVHRDDLRWLLALSGPRIHQGNAGMYRRTGLDAVEGAKTNRVLASAVAGGAHQSREQLAEALRTAGLAAEGLGLAYRIMYAEASGVLVSGIPVRSAGGALKQSYALFDERVPADPATLMERPAALAELVRRYFASRGPATDRDCADWSGLTLADVRAGLQLVRDSTPGTLETVRIDGVDFHLATEPAVPVAVSGPPRIDLIQCYDEYVMGYSASRHYLGGEAPFAPAAGEPAHLVLRDGRLAGVWRHRFVGGRCELDIRLRTRTDPETESGINQAVASYGRFLGLAAIRVG